MKTFTCIVKDCPENGRELDFGDIEVSEVCCGGCGTVTTA